MLVWLVLGSVGVLVVMAVSAEAVLKTWARSMDSVGAAPAGHQTHGEAGKGSWTLAPNVAAERDPHFSAVHWSEMQAYRKRRGRTERRVIRTSEVSVDLSVLSDENFDGTTFSVRERERVTLGQPVDSTREILCFGGSTTFCIEVADQFTWPSVLQRSLNATRGSTTRVRNLGISGTPGLERINTFRYACEPRVSDIAVFLFGDNDAGWVQYGRRNGQVHKYLHPVLRLLLRLSTRSHLCAWLYGELSSSPLRRLAVEMAETTTSAAEKANDWAMARGTRVLFVLQPNIYTLARRDDWDQRIISGTARDLAIMLEAAYEHYRAWVARVDFAVSATHIFDSESPSPYMGDWSHANTRGNELIGNFVFEELSRRKWL